MRAVGPRLKDLGRWSSGGTPPRDREELWEGDLPWISAKDFDNGSLREPTTFVTEEAGTLYSRIAPAGSIFLIVRGMALAHGLQVAETRGRVAFNQDLRALAVASQFVPRYVYYALRGSRFRLDAHIDRAAHGTARVTDSLIDERVLAPSHREQQRLADFLDRECGRIDDVLTAWRSQIDAFDAFRSSVVRDDVRSLRHVRLKHAATVLDCKHRTPEYTEAGLPLISTREVTRGELIVDERTRRVSVEDFADLREGGRDPRGGDLIYSRNASVGVAAVVGEESAVCMGQDVVLITRRPRGCELVGFVLNWAVADQVDRQSLGSTFSRINVPTIRELIVPDDTPEREGAVLDALRARFRALDGLENTLLRQQQTLTEYRDALITEAVTGKLDVARLSDQQMDESAHAAMEGEAAEVLSA